MVYRQLLHARPRIVLRASLPRLYLAPRGATARYFASELHTADVRTRLREELKQAMKAKDSFRSTTIRSALAEITNADKANKGTLIADDNILSLLQKSIARRTESASQFRSASRNDLAEKEEAECQVLSGFLPAQLSEEEIENRLREAFSKLESTTGNPGALVGKLMKAFYETTERASVQADAVSKKAREIIQSAASSK
ncbi:YqeY domain-containing protein [Rhizoctonia solani AG-1 IA]|uniref:Altered inheritance of mitochondria protein 41 n=1 Tax=Thanatephorus cucumeris (strain AG1-IA) TaxID=983506 RepID=L8X537_THACA|nr:YqeY domain-containing protein [Rhizoctonia solani AG-1 IA]